MSIFCITFTGGLNDDIRDALMETAYLMLRSFMKRKKVKSPACEGEVRRGQPLSWGGISGIEFTAQLEAPQGNILVKYLVRPQDMPAAEEAEFGFWASLEGGITAKRRENPIYRLARKRGEN